MTLNGNTRNYLIKKRQGLINDENNRRYKYYCAQLNKKTWIVLCFEKEDMGNLWNAWSMSALTKFHTVRLVQLEDVVGKTFLHFSCCYQERVGTPCCHVVCETDGVLDFSMVDVRWYKAFQVHYGLETSVTMF